MYKILIVDDEVRVLTDIKAAFSGIANYDIITAINATEALILLNKETVDFLVVDYLLGKPYHGNEFIRILKKDPVLKDKYKKLPIVLMTGSKGKASLELTMVSLGIDTHDKKDGWGKLVEKVMDHFAANKVNSGGIVSALKEELNGIFK